MQQVEDADAGEGLGDEAGGEVEEVGEGVGEDEGVGAEAFYTTSSIPVVSAFD